ncbi:PAAR-like domain-containing protein [Agrobacterium sp. lyk4-40-TYG-31]|uniref:PAAR-like domain-containing protein n=1 Tax=Agrobacterium sp. lyk4-40-TYG-31 TaxID=3040276 RepID=UPI00254CC361|nr:PAAR-like domain-containing protein [Agrobacterium sp. lyk4-40-TYG-31]
MAERSFPDPIVDDNFSALYGLPPGTRITGPPMNGSLLTKTPDGRTPLLRYDGPWPPEKTKKEVTNTAPPKPTAADPPPPEIVPKEHQALAIVTSPDVCRSPKAPIPYMAWGTAFEDVQYSPNVRANGKLVKLQISKFCRCHGDEGGRGGGVISNTCGDVVEPVSSSTIVRANGEWVQRHTDKCTLNNGNAPGEYVYPKSEQTDQAPDGKDEQNKTRDERIADYANSKGWTRGDNGGWNTSGGGWASNDKVGEEMDYVNSGRGNVQPFSMGSGPSEIKPYTPSWTENIEHSVQDRLMSWGMDTYQAGELGRKVGGAAGFVPLVGNSLSANDASRSFGSGQYLMGAIQSVGAIIGIGPGRLLTKGAERGAEKVVQNQVEQAATRALEEKAAKEAAERLAKEQAEAAARREAVETATTTGAKGTRVTKPELLPDEGKVGTYGDLVKAGTKGDNITPHHIPSSNRMAKEGVAKKDGVAINMEQPTPGSGGRHRSTFTYGNQADMNMTPRDALAAGVWDARRIYQSDGLYTPEIRKSLQEMIQMNKTNHPTIFEKKP